MYKRLLFWLNRDVVENSGWIETLLFALHKIWERNEPSMCPRLAISRFVFIWWAEWLNVHKKEMPAKSTELCSEATLTLKIAFLLWNINIFHLAFVFLLFFIEFDAQNRRNSFAVGLNARLRSHIIVAKRKQWRNKTINWTQLRSRY